MAVADPLFYNVRVDDDIHCRHASQLLHNRGESEVDDELKKALEAARPLKGVPPTAPRVSHQPLPTSFAQPQILQPLARAASLQRASERPAALSMAASLPKQDLVPRLPAPTNRRLHRDHGCHRNESRLRVSRCNRNNSMKSAHA